MRTYLIIALGSALGGAARHAVGQWALIWLGAGFPWGTLIVNATGSLAIGAIAALAAGDSGPAMGETTRLFLAVGVCGGFTTFSAFSLQTLNLIEAGALAAAAANIVGSVALCLVAVWAGYQLVQALSG
ncbi:MAG: CrcB family protein [Rhodospirillaceae bacterium]|nr:CrcB family protein [Rhodospirillaceae bacterium]